MEGSGPAFVIGTPGSAGVTIENDDAAPLVSIAATQPNANEVGPVDGQFTISLNKALPFAINAGYTLGGTATDGLSYQYVNSSVYFPAGTTTETVNIVPCLDGLYGGPETVQFALNCGTGYNADPDASTGTVTIAEPRPATAGNRGHRARDDRREARCRASSPSRSVPHRSWR